MDNFNFQAPTRVIFGKNTESQAGALCKQYGAHKVLVHFGGNSAKKSGILDRVCASLQEAGLEYILLGGVVPNPRLSKVYEGIELCKAEGVDFILAVGGGSTIDSSKAIAYGLANEGDVWEYYEGKRTVTGSIPTAAVLTIAAAGSEMSTSSVITNEEGWLKRGLTSTYAYCKFCILNPELTYTLPAYQTASGCVDIMMHTLERFFTAPETKQLDIIDRISENILKNTIRNAKIALQDPTNYDARAEIMWCGSLSHNDTTGERSFGDWACHQIEHELSGIWDIAHGAGLAAIWGSWARYVYKYSLPRFVQLAVNVMGVPNDFRNPEATALEGIAKMEEFFRSIDMPTKISDMGIELTEENIKELAYKCSFMGKRTVGKVKALDIADMEAIYRAAK